MLDREHENAARFLDVAIQHFRPGDRATLRVLDFGCGGGALVSTLARLGYDAFGCDVKPYWAEASPGSERMRIIARSPYALPFDAGSCDVVVSTSVLEHAQNKEEVFPEIHRVLAPSGVALQLYPSKWYLPTEPHIYVPLANVFWPHCPGWWLSLWALLGVRNEYQHGMGWRDVARANRTYCRDGLSYWSHRRYRRLSLQVFGNYADATGFFMEHGYGGLATLARRLRVPPSFAGAASSTFRMSFLVNRKTVRDG
jgi:SAM-dependent methyltransferase